ncbi:MAG TPA: ATP-binding cassette domain-containing protein, partial [Verrucomicrobiae bacterium]|nr:ATP-binding cassette domain-containing protein [Verrucomicrobiae bacterium]
MPDVLVHLDSVEKSFPGGRRPALDGISAQIRSGVVTGLVGPDGAGKTTLMRLIAGLMLPSAGVVRVEGGGALREFIGYMPQKFGLYEDLSVQENLDLHADLRGVVGAER